MLQQLLCNPYLPQGYCTTTLTSSERQFINCQGDDMFRLPVGRYNGVLTIGGSPSTSLNIRNLFCQLSANSIPGSTGLDSIQTIPVGGQYLSLPI